MTEKKDSFGPLTIVVTDEVVDEKGKYEIQYRGSDGNISDVDSVPDNFYRNMHWKSRIRGKIEDMVKKTDEQDFNFDEEWENLRKEWVGTLKVVEEEKKKEKNGEDKKETSYEWDEEYLEKKAEEKLNSAKLLSYLDKTIHHLLTGETKNSLLLFLTYMTSKTIEPNVLRPTGESSIGKSFLVTKVAKLLPREMKVIREGFSKMAPWNKAKPHPDGEENTRYWNLWGKIIIILEEENSEEFLKQFRPVLSHDEEMITYEVSNTESKSRDTLKVKMYGWPAYVGLQVGGTMDEQEETRAMSLTPESGRDKYSDAQWFDARKKETPWLEDVRKRDVEIVKKMVEEMDRYHVLIPNREKIQKYFPSRRRRHMRDWKQFISLVEAMTIIHQRQRPKLEIDGETYLLSHPDDTEAVIRIADEALVETLSNLDARVRRYWKHIGQYDKLRGYSSMLEEYKNCFDDETVSRPTLKEKYIETLLDKNLLEISEGSGSSSHTFYPRGDLPSTIGDLKKIIEKAHETEIENTTFKHLTSENIGPIDKPKITDCKDILDNNPTVIEDMDDCERVWKKICEKTPRIVRENREILQEKIEDGEGDLEELSDRPDRKDLNSVDRELGEEGKTAQQISDKIGMKEEKAERCLTTLREDGLAKSKHSQIEDEKIWFSDE